MLTQDVTKELETILAGLAEQGKEPTVALVKARLSTSVPIPALIATIKSWKSANRVPKVEVSAAPKSDADKLADLEKQVQALTQRVISLEQQLSEKS
ncbi:hypothetical protein [Vibrio mexicanus]|uniref:hypothetical protein n=1 Tax=Vibrio mexicanus TaxID=1004326 RepID=UPI00063C8BDD|nr:hypothetical protein [Vibrio mexicanus]